MVVKVSFPLSLLGAKSHVVYQPLGVVGNISAWNFSDSTNLGAVG